MDLFKLLDVSSPKIIRDTLNKTVTAFNILEEYVTETANNALSNSEVARIAAEQSLQNANSAVDTANNAEEQSRSATETATTALDTANTASANAVNALEVSNRALLDSAQAVAISNTASANANNALEKATTAVSVSDTANANASSALSNSTQAVNTANTAYQKAEEAIATANESKTESASAKGVADSAEANSISAINTATTAANTSATAEQNALAALETAQEALKHVIGSVGTQVSVNGETVTTFNADVKADVTYVDQKVADLIGSAPDTLDTLAELSGALRDNKDIIKVLEDAIATKANASDIMTILATKANKTDLDNYLHINSPVLTKDNSGNSGYIRLKDAKENTNSFTISTAANGGVGMLSTYSIGELGYLIMSSHNSTRDISYNFDDSLTASGWTTEGTPFKLNLGTDESPWGNIYGTTIYQGGKPVANAENLSAVTNATLSSDSKTLTVTKRDGTSFDFQGGSDLSNYVTTNTEQTISGTKRFTANNNTFTRTLVLGAGTPINFIGMGNGTYNTAALVCNTTDKFGVECPRESDSGSAAIIPFRIGARGGQLGTLIAGDTTTNTLTVNGKLNLKASGASEGNVGDNGIRWNTSSLPQDQAPQYVCTIDGFAQGGRQKWASIADLKTQLGVPTNYVTTNTSQTISGAKTFSGNVTVSGTLYIS